MLQARILPWVTFLHVMLHVRHMTSLTSALPSSDTQRSQTYQNSEAAKRACTSAQSASPRFHLIVEALSCPCQQPDAADFDTQQVTTCMHMCHRECLVLWLIVWDRCQQAQQLRSAQTDCRLCATFRCRGLASATL